MPSIPPAWRDHFTGTAWFLGGMLMTSAVVGAIVLATHTDDAPAIPADLIGDPAPVEVVRCPPSSYPETLISAAACGRTDELRELLARGANLDQTDARSEFRGRTALHHAVQRGDEPAVQLLLEAGAAPDAGDALGNTPLHLLALAPDVAHPLYVARFLLDAGADIEARNSAGRTPLELLEADHLRMIEQQDLAQMLLRTHRAATEAASPPAPAMQVVRQDGSSDASASSVMTVTTAAAAAPQSTAENEATPPPAPSPAVTAAVIEAEPAVIKAESAATEAVTAATEADASTIEADAAAIEADPAAGERLAALDDPPAATEAPPEVAAPEAQTQDIEPPAPPSAEQRIRTRIDAWARAWSDKAMEAYFDAYAPSFVPEGGLSMDNWRAQREVRIAGKAESIEVTLSDLAIEQHGDRASAEFTQHYRAGSYAETSRKRLDMTLHDGRWCIVSERET